MMSTAKIAISTTSSSPSRQFSSNDSGSRIRMATKVARCSRKKASQMPNRLSTPPSMIFSTRPECDSWWKAGGRLSTCSKNSAIAASRRRCASRSACSETRMLAIDADQPDAAPDRQQPDALRPGFARRLSRPLRQNVDDLPKQDRFEIGERGHHDIGDGERNRQPALRSEQSDHAPIDAKEIHDQRSQ